MDLNREIDPSDESEPKDDPADEAITILPSLADLTGGAIMPGSHSLGQVSMRLHPAGTASFPAAVDAAAEFGGIAGSPGQSGAAAGAGIFPSRSAYRGRARVELGVARDE